MQLNQLSLRHFRNYAGNSTQFDPVCNIFYGDNAQGKTNLLEAIVCLSTGKSPRTHIDRELIQFNQEGFYLEGTAFSRNRDFTTTMEVTHHHRKKITVNKIPAKSLAELSGILNTVYFSPEDLQLIREGAAARRRFLDASLSQLRPKYAAALSEYNRLWEHKTRILRDNEGRPDLIATLPDFNLRMAETGAILIHYRARFTQLLAKYAAAAHKECSGSQENLELLYHTVSTIEDPFSDHKLLVLRLLEHQKTHAMAELTSRQCLSGPHKDEVEVRINNTNAKSFASQGQTRTAALALKLAAREIHKDIMGEYPILLLDDVLSDLDVQRQEYVLTKLNKGQVFITCCENDRFHSLLQGKVFHVKQGTISAL